MIKTESRARNGWTACRRGGEQTDVAERARRQLARDCPRSYYFKDIDLDYCRGVLTARGCVPTYSLRAVLDSILSHVEGVEQVDNQVNVISSSGLSSIRGRSMHSSAKIASSR